MIGRDVFVIAAILALGRCEPALAQQLGQGGAGTEIAWWRLIGAFLICVALAVAGALALKSRMRGGLPKFGVGKRRLQLIDTLRLSHQVDVCLFALDDRDFLIAATPQGAVVLHVGNADAPSIDVT